MMPHRRAYQGIVSAVLAASLHSTSASSAAERPANMFANPSFERGRDCWYVSKAAGTDAKFGVDDQDAADCRYSVKVTLGRAAGWGSQFGQSFDAGHMGKTYTFAVMAKATQAPTKVDLQIERRAKPHDRAAKAEPVVLTNDRWTELHVTFKVEKDFPQGWFAYVSCTQPNAEYRADAFRLYEGEYLPYEQAAKEHAALEGVHLFDTAEPSAAEWPPAAMAARQGWLQLPEDALDHSFKGDAVVMHRTLAVVVRRHGAGVEIYSGTKRRALLSPAVSGQARLSSLKALQNDPFAVSVEAAFTSRTDGRLGLRLELKMGQVFVKTEPLHDTRKLRVEAPCGTAVMPDFFADDIVVHAAHIPVPKAELPGEHFLMHMLGNGDAILMTVSNKMGDDVLMALSGEQERRVIESSVIDFGEGGAIWVAALDAPNIWSVHDVGKDQADKVIPLNWRPPFPAQWRVDWRLDTGLTDSWEMIEQRPDGKFRKHGWFGGDSALPKDRKRWTSVLGRFKYPCWLDTQGNAFLEPLKKALRFQGPALIYPINRVRTTPLDRFTVVDVVRQTLGVGPCEYVLDVEAQHTSYKGRATCGTRDKLNPIYAKGEQKRKRAEIEKALDDVLVFVKFIRKRIEDYVLWGHEMQRYLAEQEKAHPDLAEFLGQMQALARGIDEHYAEREDKIKTPAYVVGLTQKFRDTLLDYEGPDAAAKCKEITEAIVVVGGNQDHLVGDCRVVAKRLRQHAALGMAVDPRVSDVAKEIRRRTHEIMRNPVSYEAPRY